jgi:hypothetical protein
MRSPFNTLYFYCLMHYVFFLERLYFSFQFCLVLFAAINGWTPTNFFWRSCLAFHLPRTLRFLPLSFSFRFLELRLAFVFCLDFCSDAVISLYQSVFWPLVHVGFHQKSCFKKVWMVLEKRKSFIQKTGTKRNLCRLWLRLLHVVLDVELIVCLVVTVAWLVSNNWDCLMSLWKNHALFLLFGSINLVFSLMLYLGWLGACLHMFDSYKVAISLYDHLVFDFWCHFMLLLMMFCRYAWLWPLLLS